MIKNESGNVHKPFVIVLFVPISGPATDKFALFVQSPIQTASVLGHA